MSEAGKGLMGHEIIQANGVEKLIINTPKFTPIEDNVHSEFWFDSIDVH